MFPIVCILSNTLFWLCLLKLKFSLKKTQFLLDKPISFANRKKCLEEGKI